VKVPEAEADPVVAVGPWPEMTEDWAVGTGALTEPVRPLLLVPEVVVGSLLLVVAEAVVGPPLLLAPEAEVESPLLLVPEVAVGSLLLLVAEAVVESPLLLVAETVVESTLLLVPEAVVESPLLLLAETVVGPPPSLVPEAVVESPLLLAAEVLLLVAEAVVESPLLLVPEAVVGPPLPDSWDAEDAPEIVLPTRPVVDIVEDEGPTVLARVLTTLVGVPEVVVAIVVLVAVVTPPASLWVVEGAPEDAAVMTTVPVTVVRVPELVEA
jgi:hypothetical protein